MLQSRFAFGRTGFSLFRDAGTRIRDLHDAYVLSMSGYVEGA
ncbi:hypothetical protein [Streptomyces sp. N35]|nr:hypothetical protein [Streptomyces sp. N35]